MPDLVTGGDQARAEGAGHVMDGFAAAMGLPQLVEDIFRCLPLDSTGHIVACGYDEHDGVCDCSTLPRRLAALFPSPSPQQPDGHDHTRESEDQG
jgi:hypothetical protein